MTLADLVRRNGTEPEIAATPFVLFEERRWTHADAYAESIRWARLFLELREPERPFHVGVLMDNLPDYLFAFAGAALAGATVVGINTTQRGASLARDISHSDCQILITEPTNVPLLEPIRGELVGLRDDAILVTHRWDEGHASTNFGPDLDETLTALESRFGGRIHDDPVVRIDEGATFALVFTSGTTAAPKAVIISHGRMVSTGEYVSGLMGISPDDVGYLAMPLFHANSQQCGYMPALLRGAAVGIIRRFSRSRFLDDVRRYGVTYFNYTGKPLSYLLTMPRRPEDAENPLRVAYGNEGSYRVLREFSERFACRVIDGFGATEGGFGFTRSPEDPPGSVGKPPEHIKVLREDGTECPAARLDGHGILCNAEDAIGEIVNTAGIGKFEGYYENAEATRSRTRGGMYWSGDYGYKDGRGYLYFTGRSVDWIRVDGENFLAKPIESAIEKQPAVCLTAVYGVPDAAAGDRVMATMVVAESGDFDPASFAEFLDALPDFSPKWTPTYVRVATDVPMTPTHKILVRELRRQKFRLEEVADPIYWRSRGERAYEPFTRADYERVCGEFRAAGREHLLAI